MYTLPRSSLSAEFITRLNRFVAVVKLGGRERRVYVPNTGRLAELLIPGTTVVLEPQEGTYSYRLQYVMHKNGPVLINSVYCNQVFARLLDQKRVPGLEDMNLVRREPVYGSHRFDFLLAGRGQSSVYLEMKSCTLAWRGMASFPDAVSTRAREHVELLAETGNGILVFLIMHSGIEHFVPNYHTDFQFYSALRKNRDRLRVLAYSAQYDEDLTIRGLGHVKVQIPEVSPRGVYIIVYHCPEKTELEAGKPGLSTFYPGYYCYAGSGGNNLFKRIDRHRRKRKKEHWHVDYLNKAMTVVADIPIVTDEYLECGIAAFIGNAGGTVVKGFGSSDCHCDGHLFYFSDNPLEKEILWDTVFKWRYGRIIMS